MCLISVHSNTLVLFAISLISLIVYKAHSIPSDYHGHPGGKKPLQGPAPAHDYAVAPLESSQKLHLSKAAPQPLSGHNANAAPYIPAKADQQNAPINRVNMPKIPIVGVGDRIAGGESVSIEDYPYYVQVDIGASNCGGTIIAEDTVVTASHCVYDEENSRWFDAKQVLVYSGDGTPSHSDEQESSMKHIVHYYKYLAEYDGSVGNGYDVVLLKLIEPMVYDDYRQPIPPCAAMNDSRSHTMIGVGLGKVNETTGEGASHLQMVQLLEQNPEQCIEKFDQTYHPPADSIVCHNDPTGQSDTCSGDSGGPVVLLKDDDTTPLCLYGSVSYGASSLDCGNTLYPTVAAKISTYYNILNRRSDFILNSEVQQERNEIVRSEKTGNQSEFVRFSFSFKILSSCVVSISAAIGSRKIFSGITSNI